MSEPYDPNGGPWSSAGQPAPPPYGQNPDYGQQPPAYGQAPYGQQQPYGQPAGPFDQSNPFDQSQGLSAAPTMPYGSPAAYGQPQQQPQYDQNPYGAVSPYGQPMQGGYGAPQQGFYPQPQPQKKNNGKMMAVIGAVVVVVAIIAVVALASGGNKPTPTPVALSSSTPAVIPSASSSASAPDTTDSTAPDDLNPSDSDSLPDLSSTSYTMGECVNLTGDNNDLTVTEVDCTASNSSGQVVGIVSTGTTGDPTADAPLCMPFKYDDNDFEETGIGDGTGVLYCLSATNGQHDLRYATKGSCIYRPSGDDVQTYTVDCSNSLANYVTLGVLTNTTSDSGCDKYSSDEENFFSPTGETPTYVVCAKKK